MLVFLLVVVIVMVVAAGSVASFISRSPVFWRGGLVLSGVLLALALTNPLGRDDFGGLSDRDRRSARSAVDSAAGCEGPLVRVAKVEPSSAAELSNGFEFRCEWTLFGWPSFSGEAQCADGHWYVPGWRELNFTNKSCRP